MERFRVKMKTEALWILYENFVAGSSELASLDKYEARAAGQEPEVLVTSSEPGTMVAQ